MRWTDERHETRDRIVALIAANMPKKQQTYVYKYKIKTKEKIIVCIYC